MEFNIISFIFIYSPADSRRALEVVQASVSEWRRNCLTSWGAAEKRRGKEQRRERGAWERRRKGEQRQGRGLCWGGEEKESEGGGRGRARASGEVGGRHPGDGPWERGKAKMGRGTQLQESHMSQTRSPTQPSSDPSTAVRTCTRVLCLRTPKHLKNFLIQIVLATSHSDPFCV